GAPAAPTTLPGRGSATGGRIHGDFLPRPGNIDWLERRGRLCRSVFRIGMTLIKGRPVMAANWHFPQPAKGNWRARRGCWYFLVVGVGLCLLGTLLGEGRATADDRKTGPIPRVSRVSPAEATGAVEVSVAINPTNPDHLIAASIARMKDSPGITDFAYVT